MDKEKRKKYAVYAALGMLGGIIGVFLVDYGIYSGGQWDRWLYQSQPYIRLGPILGGLLVGVIAKKWWVALIEGLIISGLLTWCLFLYLSNIQS